MSAANPALIRAQQPLSRTRALIELTFAGMLWGLGFIAAVWTLREAGTMAITGWRFVIAGIVGVLFARRFFASRASFAYLRAAWLPGILIALTIILQTWGLTYTTATKSAFLTCLYVLIVPLLEPFFGGKKPALKIFICSALALIGVAMMCGLFTSESLDEKSRPNFGDLLTLLCALAASAHILAIARVDRKLGREFNGFDFNTAQSLGAGIPTMLIAIAVEPGALRMPIHLAEIGAAGNGLPMLGFLSLTFLSTLVGFALQVRAQRVLSPSTASLIFLLESPFAAFFAFIFLGEVLGPLQLAGGAIILAAVAYSSFNSISEAKT